MALSVLASKLRIPTLRHGLVPRPRLTELLQRGTTPKLTLLSAPAGFGKTTLLAEWLDGSHVKAGRLAWLSLDPADKDPQAFWTSVVTALQKVVPGVGPAVLELIAGRPLQTDLVLASVLHELTEAAGTAWLVLDDYHLVDSHDIGNGMAFLLDHLPPNVHIVISTRADPLLPLPRWRVRGELLEIRAAGLRFTPEEAAAYFNGAAELALTPDQVAALEQRTEGWIAALQLAALSLKDRADVTGFIEGFAGNDRYILDYLVEEVLQQQPAQVRDFLLLTSVLDRFTGSLCDAVTGGADGQHMLMALDRANVFMVPLDDRREWYRYHHLFADMLQARLLSEQPGQIPLLHQRASRWHEDHGQFPEAVRHALAAQDFDRAAHLMELAAAEIRRKRQEWLLLGWLKELPDAVIRRSPVLSVYYGFMLLASGKLDGVEPRLADAERALEAAPEGAPEGAASRWADIEEIHTLPATIAIYRASLAQAHGDVAATSMYARHALELASPGDHLSRGAAAGFLGFAAWAEGDIHAGLETFTQAVASLHAAGNRVDELGGTVVLADLWLAAGLPHRARQLMQSALKQAQAQGESVARATAELHGGLGELDCEAGDVSGARLHLEAAEVLLQRAPMTESRFRWFAARGLLAQAEEEMDAAISFFDQAQELYRPGFFPDVRPLPAMKARVWIAQGKLAEASDWARERGVSTADDADYLREFDHLTLVRLLIARQRAAQQQAAQPQAAHQQAAHHQRHTDAGAANPAAALLERLLEAAGTFGRTGSLLEIRMLQALTHQVQGHRAQALEALGRAFAQAPEPDEHVRLFLNEGAPMLELLHDATHHGVGGDHAYRLLRLAASAPAQAADAQPGLQPPSSAELLSEREIQVLRLLGSELSGPQIAGELFISYNTLRTHTKHIFTKLGVTDRRAAVRRARERGLM
jgi:LuxR family maltose regulon positive regulatory protein